MALDTPREVNQLVIYQVFPRQHGPEGKLTEVTADLPRIADLGVDVVYLMPIHPIGVEGRKGTFGSPYAISDYRAVNPDLGTEDDLVELIDRAHELGMRVIIDVVYNHTSPDSVLVREHPEFFNQDENGRPVTSVPAWWDIVDLKHDAPGLRDYLIGCLQHWVELGVDGFRCDVANIIPLDLWRQARKRLATVKPGLFWIAESPHPMWIAHRRKLGQTAHADSEVHEAFDALYDHDLWAAWQAVVLGSEPVHRYVEHLRAQEGNMPEGGHKLRFVENHDNYRVMYFVPNRDQALAWTAFAAFNPGPLMLFAGQESASRKWPRLFEKDPIDFGSYELSDSVRRLTTMKKHQDAGEGMWIIGDSPVLQAVRGSAVASSEGPLVRKGLLGLFNVEGKDERVELPLPDGSYTDLLGGPDVLVEGGTAKAPASAAVVEFEADLHPRIPHSPILDTFMHVETSGDD